jgi:hypothetical protein
MLPLSEKISDAIFSLVLFLDVIEAANMTCQAYFCCLFEILNLFRKVQQVYLRRTFHHVAKEMLEYG